MCAKVYINGVSVDEQNATISVFDHGLLYGDGVFEGIRSYGGKVFLLDEHLDRLWNSAKAIRLKMPASKETMKEVINQAVAENEAELNKKARAAGKAKGGSDDETEAGYIRLVVTRGRGDLGLGPDLCDEPQWIVIVDRIKLYPKEVYQKGLEIVTASTQRTHPGALNPRIKSLNYLNNILAKIEGQQAGCKEALMLNHKGEVAECTGDNIFVVHGRVLSTPPTDAGILEGITRAAVIRLARETGYEVRETALTKHDVYIADECFLTGTAAEVVPVVKVDGRPIGNGTPGPITGDLARRFHKLTRS
jgi:branched-chain amino acid aminotransferase